jgi:hypothetical protein
MTDIIQHYKTPAHTLDEGDQVIINDELCTIRDIQHGFDVTNVWVENITDQFNDYFELDPDAEYWIWSI